MMKPCQIPAVLFVTAVLLVAAPIQAAVLFYDGFETEDGHGTSGSTEGFNGWFLQGSNQAPSIHFGDSDMDGQYANAQGWALAGGSGHSDWRNAAGIGNGLTPGLEYTLSWKWKVNVGNANSYGNGFGFENARASMGVKVDQGGGISVLNFADPDDNDVLCFGGCGIINETEGVFDMKIVMNETDTTFFVNNIERHSSPTNGAWGNAFTSATGIRGFFGGGQENGGYFDEIMLTDSTPNLANAWRNDGSGDWNADSNWNTLAAPNSSEAGAVFGDAISSNQTVFTNSDVNVSDVRFDNANSYVIAGGGKVNVNGDFSVAAGSHQFQTAVQVNNNSTADVAAGSTLTFNNSLDLQGNTLDKTGDGEMALNNKLATTGGAVNLLGGTISGSGTIGGSVSNSAGTTAPGNSPGILTIDGDYTQGAAGTLAIEIQGTTPGDQYDRLIVNGQANLAGTLDVSLTDFTPSNGDTFDILDFSSVSGNFDTLNLPNDFSWDVTTGILTVGSGGPGLQGDFDGNGVVDAADYTLWQDGLNGAYTQADYLVWKNNFGNSSGGGSSAAVPEPTCWMMLVIGLATFVGRRLQAARG